MREKHESRAMGRRRVNRAPPRAVVKAGSRITSAEEMILRKSPPASSVVPGDSVNMEAGFFTVGNL
jgi:hypothetical protein